MMKHSPAKNKFEFLEILHNLLNNIFVKKKFWLKKKKTYQMYLNNSTFLLSYGDNELDLYNKVQQTIVCYWLSLVGPKLRLFPSFSALLLLFVSLSIPDSHFAWLLFQLEKNASARRAEKTIAAPIHWIEVDGLP